LAIQLINYAIEKEWANFEDDTNRPKWIRQGELIRCDCDKCFFCKTGKTTGISHKVVGTGRNKRKRRIKCTKDRVVLSNSSGQYCRQCYRDQKSLSRTSKEKRKNCRYTRMGCPACKEPICEECWNSSYKNHDHCS